MSQWLRAFRIGYEIVGGIAICYCLLWYALSRTGGLNAPSSCLDTNVTTVHSPGGTEVARQRLRTCGSHSSVEVLLNVPETESNFMRVISLAKVPVNQVSFRWTGPRDLEITFPEDADIEEAYGVVWGVTITRNIVRPVANLSELRPAMPIN